MLDGLRDYLYGRVILMKGSLGNIYLMDILKLSMQQLHLCSISTGKYSIEK
jgi:hypothetical protein